MPLPDPIPLKIQSPISKLVTSDLLGTALIPGVRYENADGTALTVDSDYFGRSRNRDHPAAGPFEIETTGKVTLKVR